MLDSSLDEVNTPTLLLRRSKEQITPLESVKFWQVSIKNIQAKTSLILAISQ